MGVLGTKKLLELIRKKKLIEDLSERELKHPEGTGFDLRIRAAYKIVDGEGFIGINDRSTPRLEKLVEYNPKKPKYLVLRPGSYVITETIEKVNMPNNMLALFRPRLTLLKSGVTGYTAACGPGYSGRLSFGVHNAGNNNFRIEMGARYAHIMFYPIEGGIVQKYRGQWRGGRISTQGKREKQV